MRQRTVETPEGPARVHLGPRGDAGSVVLTHGAGGGIDAPDLQALAQALGVGALQGCVQARQQVGKAKVAAQALALQHPRAHPGRRVQAQRHAYLG